LILALATGFTIQLLREKNTAVSNVKSYKPPISP
jgi:hypothetical protein